MSYESQIDVNALMAKMEAKDQLFAMWHAVAGTGETLEEFREASRQRFMEEMVPLIDSGIVIVDYPEDCDEYSATIQNTKLELEMYKM